MDISFITVNYNSTDETIQLIHSIHKHTSKLSYEVIIVDNNSNDDELTKLRVLENDKRVIIIYNPINEGFAQGNMHGVQKASGKYYFFLNNDTLLLNETANILKDFLDNNPKTALATAQLFQDESTPTTSFKKFPSLANKLFGNFFVRLLNKNDFPSNKARLSTPTKVSVVSGSCMFFRASIFNTIGGLDTNFFLYCEEEDISKRIWNSGYEVYIVPEAKLIHIEGASTQKSYEIEREYYISYNLLLKKHFNKLEAFVFKGLTLLKLLRRTLRGQNYAKLFYFVLRGSPKNQSLRYKQLKKENYNSLKNQDT
jgi:hypothetical protein